MHEIQFAEQDIRANEDKILELMVNAEAREKSVKAAELEFESGDGGDRKRKKPRLASALRKTKSSSRSGMQNEKKRGPESIPICCAITIGYQSSGAADFPRFAISNA